MYECRFPLLITRTASIYMGTMYWNSFVIEFCILLISNTTIEIKYWLFCIRFELVNGNMFILFCYRSLLSIQSIEKCVYHAFIFSRRSFRSIFKCIYEWFLGISYQYYLLIVCICVCRHVPNSLTSVFIFYLFISFFFLIWDSVSKETK